MSDKPEDQEGLESIPQVEKTGIGDDDDRTPEELIGVVKIWYKSKRNALLLTPRRIIIAYLAPTSPLAILLGVGFGWWLGQSMANKKFKTLRNMPPDDVLNLSGHNFEIMHTNIENIHVKQGWSGEIKISEKGKKKPYKFGPNEYKIDLPLVIDLIKKTPLSDRLTVI